MHTNDHAQFFKNTSSRRRANNRLPIWYKAKSTIKADPVRICAQRYTDAQATSNGRPKSLLPITPKFVDINPQHLST